MMKATATTAFAIVGLMYLLQEHSVEMKQSNTTIETYKKQQFFLESNLTTSIKDKKRLKGKNLQLLTELDKVNLKYKLEIDNFNQLLSKKDEQSKKVELEYQAKEKELLVQKNRLEDKISKILTIDKMQKIDSLLTTQEVLEANLTAEIAKENQLKEKNSKLKTIINKMLQIAEDATQKASIEHDKDIQEYQSLLSKYQNLEENLLIEEKNSYIEKNKKLVFEMSELLFISKESRDKAEIEHQDKIKELELQLAKEIEKEQNLEANLTTEIEQENLLKEKNRELKDKLVKQIESAKEEKESALVEAKEKIKELEIKLAQEIKEKTSLESNLTKELEQEESLVQEKSLLESKIAEQISLLDQEAKKEQILEANLTAQIEKETLLIEKKVNLESQIAQLTATIEDKNQEIASKEKLHKKDESTIKELTQKRDELKELAKERAEQITKEQKATKTALLAVEKAKEEMQNLLKEIADKKKAQEEKLIQEKKIAKEKLLDAFNLTHVEFELNSMKLTDKSEELLNSTAEVMKRYPNFHYNIQGHTDSRGNEEFNVKLSGQRAEQVKKYLISRGIRAEILTTEGIGSAKPIADNETEEGRNLNRRVVFEIIKE